MLIQKMLFPLIKRFWVLFLSMVAVSCLGIALMTGLQGTYYSFLDGYSKYITDYAYPDAVITTSVTVENREAALRNVKGVKDVNSRMYADLALKTDNRTITLRIFSFEEDHFQKFYIREEAEGGEYPEIYLECRFSENNGISAGDLVQLNTAEGYKTFFVSKIVSSPECIHIRQNAYSWGDNSDFGYGFLPSAHAGTVFGSEEYRNQYLFRFESDSSQGQTAKEILEECKKTLEGQTILDSFVYEDSLVKKTIDINTDPLKALSILLPALVFVLTLLMIILFLSQIIRQCRYEIGIMRALGFSGLQVTALFCSIVLIVTVVASVIGILLGGVVANFTGNLYAEDACMPLYKVNLPVNTCIAAVCITVLTELAAAMISAVSIIKIQPSEAMHAKTVSKAQFPRFVEKLLSDGKPILKFTVLSAIRNAGRFLISVICIAAALTLILSGLAFDYAKDSIVTQLFDERIDYDCQILLRDYPDENIEKGFLELHGVTAIERVVFLTTEVTFGEKTESILVNGVVSENSLVNIIGEDGHIISVPEEGIVLDGHLASRLGVKAGDRVTVGDTQLTVTALSDHYVSRIQYTSVSQALKLSDSCGGALLVNTENEEELIDYASSIDGYGGATFTRLLRKTTEASFETFSVAVYIVLLFSFCLGMLIVFHMTKANITEQQHELGVIRILGFQRWQISFCWLGQSLVQYILALLVGLPSGTAVAKYMLAEMSTSHREYPFSNDPWQYAVTVLLVLAFVLASHFLAMAEMRRWNLAETAKSNE